MTLPGLISVGSAAVNLSRGLVHQKDCAVGYAKIIPDDQQSLVQNRLGVAAGEDQLGYFLKHGYFANAGVKIFSGDFQEMSACFYFGVSSERKAYYNGRSEAFRRAGLTSKSARCW